MRPRLITAENPRPRHARRRKQSRFNEAAAHHRGEHDGRAALNPATACFNEAAAHHRGERARTLRACGTDYASMRPRLITAENPPRSPSRRPTTRPLQ